MVSEKMVLAAAAVCAERGWNVAPYSMQLALEAADAAREVPAAKTFEEAFAETGYQYGDEEKEGVRLGWELAQSSLLTQRQQPPQAVEQKPGSPTHVALWNAINEFAQHGPTSTSVAKQKAVVRVEEALSGYINSLCPSVPQAVWKAGTSRDLMCPGVLTMQCVDCNGYLAARTAERDTAQRDLANAREQLAAKEEENLRLERLFQQSHGCHSSWVNEGVLARVRAEAAERALTDTKARFALAEEALARLQAASDGVSPFPCVADLVAFRRIAADIARSALTETAEPAPQPVEPTGEALDRFRALALRWHEYAERSSDDSKELRYLFIDELEAELAALKTKGSDVQPDPAAPRDVTPRPNAPRDVALLPDWWDGERLADGKPDKSRCAAELRVALAQVKPVELAKPEPRECGDRVLVPYHGVHQCDRALGHDGACSVSTTTKPAKPQVTLEAFERVRNLAHNTHSTAFDTDAEVKELQRQVVDLRVAVRYFLECWAAGSFNKDAAARLLRTLDTDHAEAGKGDM